MCPLIGRSERMPGKMPEGRPEYMPWESERLSDRKPDRMSYRMPEREAEFLQGCQMVCDIDMTNYMPDRFADETYARILYMPNAMPEGVRMYVRRMRTRARKHAMTQ